MVWYFIYWFLVWLVGFFSSFIHNLYSLSLYTFCFSFYNKYPLFVICSALGGSKEYLYPSLCRDGVNIR